MASTPHKVYQPGLALLASAEKDEREKWERDVEQLAAELLSQHTAEEVAVIAAQHILYRKESDAHKAALKDLNSVLCIQSAMKFSFKQVVETAIEYRKEYNSRRASRSAKKSHEKRPQTADKAFVFECWKEWRADPARYGGKAAFARDMLDKCGTLKSQKKIEDWCREWEKLEPC